MSQVQGQDRVATQAGQMICFHYQQPRHMRRDCPEVEIARFWDISVPIISGTCAGAVCSSFPQRGSEEPVPVPGCYISTSCRTNRPESGSRTRARLTGWDFYPDKADSMLLLTGSEYVHKFITQLPKDYYLIPGKLHHKT